MTEDDTPLTPLNEIPPTDAISETDARKAVAALQTFINVDLQGINKLSDLSRFVAPVGKHILTILTVYGTRKGDDVMFRDFSTTGGITPDTTEDVQQDIVHALAEPQSSATVQYAEITGEVNGQNVDISSSFRGGVTLSENWGQPGATGYLLHLPTEGKPFLPHPTKMQGLTPFVFAFDNGQNSGIHPTQLDPLNVRDNRRFMEITQRAVRNLLQLTPPSRKDV